MDNKNYLNPSNIVLVSKIIKKQNIDLINKICDMYNFNEDKRALLLNKFIKVNYYCPRIILDSNKEGLQKYFIKKY
jgi:hypothetical protein